jgi:hypothetical protein
LPNRRGLDLIAPSPAWIPDNERSGDATLCEVMSQIGCIVTDPIKRGWEAGNKVANLQKK